MISQKKEIEKITYNPEIVKFVFQPSYLFHFVL